MMKRFQTWYEFTLVELGKVHRYNPTVQHLAQVAQSSATVLKSLLWYTICPYLSHEPKPKCYNVACLNIWEPKKCYLRLGAGKNRWDMVKHCSWISSFVYQSQPSCCCPWHFDMMGKSSNLGIKFGNNKFSKRTKICLCQRMHSWTELRRWRGGVGLRCCSIHPPIKNI